MRYKDTHYILINVQEHFWAFICVIRHTKEKNTTFINVNIKVIKTILKVNRDNRQTLNCKTPFINIFMTLTVCNSIGFLDNLRMDKTNINALVQLIKRSLHLIHQNRFLIKQ